MVGARVSGIGFLFTAGCFSSWRHEFFIFCWTSQKHGHLRLHQRCRVWHCRRIPKRSIKPTKINKTFFYIEPFMILCHLFGQLSNIICSIWSTLPYFTPLCFNNGIRSLHCRKWWCGIEAFAFFYSQLDFKMFKLEDRFLYVTLCKYTGCNYRKLLWDRLSTPWNFIWTFEVDVYTGVAAYTQLGCWLFSDTIQVWIKSLRR